MNYLTTYKKENKLVTVLKMVTMLPFYVLGYMIGKVTHWTFKGFNKSYK